ncbi:chorismate-binding protein [Thermophagus sp. OGC60D27]|uniref:chorismate-binding protein n=1 Tax=Thermophagus sp. OGC60D27 TaxID=3458415 RepID=UPI0040383E61
MDNFDNINSITDWLSGCLVEHQPFVVYRFPGEKKGHVFRIGKMERVDVNHFSTEHFNGSFLVAPFYLSGGAYLLWPEEEKSFELESKNFKIEGNGIIELGAEAGSVRDGYRRSFSIVKEALETNFAEKVVLARRMEVSGISAKLLPEVFETLCYHSPNAFVYFFDHPTLGRWMGASPENFLGKHGNEYTTVALAATRAKGQPSEAWNFKELEEQGFVSRFIDKILNDFGAADVSKNGPEPIRAGQVIHLRTSYRFNADLKGAETGRLLNSLHPTPAVGGFPKDKALDVIQRAEPFDRRFYSGFLGPVFSGGFRFFVNIRSMQLEGEKAVLYLGGGITRESVESSEWEETRLKSRTLLSVLQSVKQNHCNESIHL